MFVKIYRDSEEMLAIQPLTFDKVKDSVVIASYLENFITFKSSGIIEKRGDWISYGYLMCNGECYNATPEGYQEFLKEVVNKL